MKTGKHDKKFHKLVNLVVQKNSPSRVVKPLTDEDDDEMGIEEEADAVDQEGKRARRKALDPNPNNNL